MRKFLQFLLLVQCIISPVYAGDELKKSLENTVNEYFDFVNNKNYTQLVEYLNPAIFSFASKEQIIQSMKGIEDSTVSINTHSNSIDKISKIIDDDGFYYALVNYSYVIDITAHHDFQEAGDDYYNLLTGMYKDIYGKKNVGFSDKTKVITITANNSMYAVTSKAELHWKFLEKKDGMERLIQVAIPERVIKILR